MKPIMAKAKKSSALDNWPGILWLARDQTWPRSSRGNPDVSSTGYKREVSISPPAFRVDW